MGDRERQPIDREVERGSTFHSENETTGKNRGECCCSESLKYYFCFLPSLLTSRVMENGRQVGKVVGHLTSPC